MHSGPVNETFAPVSPHLDLYGAYPRFCQRGRTMANAEREHITGGGLFYGRTPSEVQGQSGVEGQSPSS